jgi:hypothetical protein
LRKVALIGLLLAGMIAALGGAHAANAPGHDGDLWWDGLGHDSRSAVYRQPEGAVVSGDCTSGTTGTGCNNIKLRFRTFRDDATAVTLRAYYTNPGREDLVEMHIVASDVPCYMESSFGCDFWEASINSGPQGTIYYRFIVHDATKTAYYEDDSDVRDGGWGKPYDASPGWGWAISVYDPDFKPIEWCEERGHLPGLPRPLPQREPKERPGARQREEVRLEQGQALRVSAR